MHVIIDLQKRTSAGDIDRFFYGDVYSPQEMSDSKFFFAGVLQDSDRLGEFLNNLEGEFSFVIFDEKTKTIYFGRDAVGVVPLYFTQLNPTSWLFATSIEEIITHQKKLEINPKYISAILSMRFGLAQSSPYKNVFRCPGGNWGKISANKIFTERYWLINDTPRSDFYESLDECVRDGAKVLSQVIRDRLTTGKGLKLFLSGGLDSSLIAAVLDRSYHMDMNVYPRPIFNTLRFPTRPEDDPEGLRLLQPILRCPIREIFVDKNQSTLWLHNSKEDPKVIFYEPNHWLFKPMLKSCISEGVEMVLTGLGGDDIFEPTPELISALSFSESRQYYKAYPFFKKKYPLVEWFWHWRIKPILIILRKVLAQIPTSFSQRWIWRLAQPAKRTICYKFVTSAKYQYGLENDQELSQKFGVRSSHPLLDRRLLDYFCRIPPRFHYLAAVKNAQYHYQTKPILRKIAKNFLPVELAERQSQQNFLNFRQDILAELQKRRPKDRPSTSFYGKALVEPELCHLYTNLCTQPTYKEQNEIEKKF